MATVGNRVTSHVKGGYRKGYDNIGGTGETVELDSRRARRLKARKAKKRKQEPTADTGKRPVRFNFLHHNL